MASTKLFVDDPNLNPCLRYELLNICAVIHHDVRFSRGNHFFYGDRVRQITGVAARSRIFGEEILLMTRSRQAAATSVPSKLDPVGLLAQGKL